MNGFSRYDWITWYNRVRNYCRSSKEKIVYLLKKQLAILGIKKINCQVIEHNPSEIRLFAIMRNESLRLPYFIEYYKKLQVDRFFIIDNNSTDNSISIALSYANVHVFRTKAPYKNHWCWMEHLLHRYGNQYWCVVVDIDELFHFPNAEHLSIRHLCQFLEHSRHTAFRTLLLDMYSDQTIQNTTYTAGQNPLDAVSYFDKEYNKIQFSFFDRLRWQFFDSLIFTGGMRDRVFGQSDPPTILSKVPLFKYLPGTYLAQGMHAINGAHLSDLQGVVFHTKFLHDFIGEVKEECVREQHYGQAFYYKQFSQHLNRNPALQLIYSNSARLRDSSHLVQLGLMKTNLAFEEYIQTLKQKNYLSVV